MAKVGTVQWHGQSGTQYQFEVYDWNTNFNDVAAVYVIAVSESTSSGNAVLTAIYVGETDELGTRLSNHHKLSCFQENAANRVCVHLESNDSARLTIESDLIANYDPTCND